MKLGTLLRDIKTIEVQGSQDGDVSSITHDSRQIQKNSMFVAIRGEKSDGHKFLNEVVKAGATSLVVEDKNQVPKDFSGILVIVKDSRKTLDHLASNFFKNPSHDLLVTGITGTNGKTTTSLMIEALLNDGGIGTGVIGTIDYHFGKKSLPSSHTTPDALKLQNILADWKSEGAKAVSMEVSSHALAQDRASSLEFDVAVFTNLTRDHLDFHKTMEDYVAAKAKLFKNLLASSPKKKKRAILNMEDSHYRELLPEGVPVWTYGFSKGDIQAYNINMSLDGSSFDVKSPAGDFKIQLQMVGKHNIANSLAALAVGLHAGIAPESIALSLKKLKGVRGRLERVSATSLRVFVDYAHTDDALKNVLSFLKTLRDDARGSEKITVVFGCGGDRDPGKRPLMLKAALAYADQVVVTSDNPRTEVPEKIIEDILAGTNASSLRDRLFIEVDRRRAIQLALQKSEKNDVVLIAGKGHEDYQIIGTQKFPFDDVQIARDILKTLDPSKGALI